MKEVKSYINRFFEFLKEDSWKSLVVTVIIAFILIRFIFFPILSLITGTSLPLVIVESCSMHHESWGEEGLEDVLDNRFYRRQNIDIEDARDWHFRNGLNKGDIIFVLGRDFEDLEVGDVVIFDAGGSATHPIIHRTIAINEEEGTFTTKGDSNPQLLEFEKDIPKENLVGRALFRIPRLGWIKLIFFEHLRESSERGFC